MSSIVGIVCHDAGGAEVVSHWVQHNKYKYLAYAEGPAIEIFNRNGIDICRSDLFSLLYQCDWLLVGTSWQSSLEKKVIAYAVNNNKFIVAFVCSISWLEPYLGY